VFEPRHDVEDGRHVSSVGGKPRVGLARADEYVEDGRHREDGHQAGQHGCGQGKPVLPVEFTTPE
jgi:hypothetical protein